MRKNTATEAGPSGLENPCCPEGKTRPAGRAQTENVPAFSHVAQASPAWCHEGIWFCGFWRVRRIQAERPAPVVGAGNAVRKPAGNATPQSFRAENRPELSSAMFSRRLTSVTCAYDNYVDGFEIHPQVCSSVRCRRLIINPKHNMAKTKNSKKQTKKAPAKSPKQKKAAKQAKKGK